MWAESRFNRVKLQTVKENTGWWGAVLLLQQQGGAVELSLNAARFDVDAVWRPAASSLTHSQTLSASLPLTMDRVCVCVCVWLSECWLQYLILQLLWHRCFHLFFISTSSISVPLLVVTVLHAGYPCPAQWGVFHWWKITQQPLH